MHGLIRKNSREREECWMRREDREPRGRGEWFGARHLHPGAPLCPHAQGLTEWHIHSFSGHTEPSSEDTWLGPLSPIAILKSIESLLVLLQSDLMTSDNNSWSLLGYLQLLTINQPVIFMIFWLNPYYWELLREYDMALYDKWKQMAHQPEAPCVNIIVLIHFCCCN